MLVAAVRMRAAQKKPVVIDEADHAVVVDETRDSLVIREHDRPLVFVR